MHYSSKAGLTLPLTAGLLMLAIAGCSSTAKTTAPQTPPNVEGSYAITGTYNLASNNNVPNSGVFGTMKISNQNGTSAKDSAVFVVEFNGNYAVMLDTIPADTATWKNVSCTGVDAGCVAAYASVLPPAQVTLAADSSFSAVFTGKELSWNQDPTTCCTDTLTLTGKLSAGNTISGDWVLTISAPVNGRDAGTFVAQR